MDTPRTDEVFRKYKGNDAWLDALDDLARQLERDLAAANAQVERMEGALRDLLDAQAEEVGAEFYAKANDAARLALAALDKE